MHSNLTLSNITPDEVTEEYVSWLRDPEINRFLESRHQKITLMSQKKFIEDVNASHDSSIFGIYLNPKLMVGTIKVGPINAIHKTGYLGILIGSRKYHGMGIATNAISALCSTLGQNSLLRKVNAGVISGNFGSLKAFEKNGFTIEGLCIQQMLDTNGRPLDVILLGKLLNTPQVSGNLS